MSHSCLISIYGPSDVLAAICAVRHYSQLFYGQPYTQVVTLLHNPGMSGESAAEAADTVERIIVGQGWSKPVTITGAEMDKIIGKYQALSLEVILQRFQQHIGLGQIDDVFYSHNVVGYAPDLAMCLYPNARHITFGESMGSVTSKEDYLGEMRRLHVEQSRQSRAKRFVRQVYGWFHKLRSRNVSSAPDIPSGSATAADLILPLDYFGNYLNDKELFIVPRELVLEVIASCQQALPDLVACSQSFLKAESSKPFLMLIGNLTDANLTTIEGEVEMYENVVRQYAPKGSAVFVKGHPLAVARISDMLVARLQTDYRARRMPPSFSRYPIELWHDLVQRCEVMSFSYSAISLRYLYGKPVIYWINEDLIETYFRAETKEFFKNTDKIYRGVLTNLAVWDGQSILWRGSLS